MLAVSGGSGHRRAAARDGAGPLLRPGWPDAVMDTRPGEVARVDTEATGRPILGPLRSAYPWVVWGLIVQALGVGSVAVVVWRSVRNQSFGSYVTAQMFKFAWHAQLHTRTGLTVLAAGAVVYAIGSVVMARPYVTRPATLFVAVPIAAVAGMLVLGVLALVVAALVSAFGGFFDGGGDAGTGAEARRRRRRA
jgi:hypothetical protein